MEAAMLAGRYDEAGCRMECGGAVAGGENVGENLEIVSDTFDMDYRIVVLVAFSLDT
jgi:hypothetical protein